MGGFSFCTSLIFGFYTALALQKSNTNAKPNPGQHHSSFHLLLHSNAGLVFLFADNLCANFATFWRCVSFKLRPHGSLPGLFFHYLVQALLRIPALPDPPRRRYLEQGKNTGEVSWAVVG